MEKLRPQRGRPPLPPEERLIGVNYTVSQEDREWLRALGAERGVPASTVLREILRAVRSGQEEAVP